MDRQTHTVRIAELPLGALDVIAPIGQKARWWIKKGRVALADAATATPRVMSELFAMPMAAPQA